MQDIVTAQNNKTAQNNPLLLSSYFCPTQPAEEHFPKAEFKQKPQDKSQTSDFQCFVVAEAEILCLLLLTQIKKQFRSFSKL